MGDPFPQTVVLHFQRVEVIPEGPDVLAQRVQLGTQRAVILELSLS